MCVYIPPKKEEDSKCIQVKNRKCIQMPPQVINMFLRNRIGKMNKIYNLKGCSKRGSMIPNWNWGISPTFRILRSIWLWRRLRRTKKKTHEPCIFTSIFLSIQTEKNTKKAIFEVPMEITFSQFTSSIGSLKTTGKM